MAEFYLDEDVPEVLAALLIGHGHGAATTRGEGRKGTPDYAQLWHATLQHRFFETLNRKDYLRAGGCRAGSGALQRQRPARAGEELSGQGPHLEPGDRGARGLLAGLGLAG